MIDEKLDEDLSKATGEKERQDYSQNKFWALLSYLSVLVVIPLLAKKDSDFCQFHAKQGLVLILGWLLSWFPVFGWIIGILTLILSVIGIVNVIDGKKKRLPFVGELADNWKF